MTDYDVGVIGAGNGGLTAGTTLALAGTRVLVLEQHNLPGGFASSFVRGRFEFEPSLHELCDVGPASDKGGVRALLEDELGVAVDFVAVPEAYRLILRREGLERAVPGSRGPVGAYLELCGEVLAALDYLKDSRGNPDRKVLRKRYANFLKTAAYSVDEVTARFRIPPKAQDILYAYWCYLGIPTSRLNFTIWAAMLYKYLTKGAYIPRYRSHEMTSALVARIQASGGRVEFNTRVAKILVEGGRVTGVQTASGRVIPCGRVICNASPTLAYNTLVTPPQAVPPRAYQDVNARIPGSSALVVYLGLDATADELGIEDYSYFIYESADTDRLYASFSELGAPLVQATICLNRAIPDCSPPGTCIVSMTVLYRPGVWERVPPAEYVATKRRVAAQLIDDFERSLNISIHGHIEEIEIATPQTFARYTGAYGGGVYGYEVESWDSILPRMMSLGQDEYIKGLSFVGGNAFRAYGYSSSLMSGQTMALLSLKDMGVRA